jgi:hypothetical protein
MDVSAHAGVHLFFLTHELGIDNEYTVWQMSKEA